MCRLFDEWSDEIKKFCDDNDLSFDSAKKLSQSWGKDDLVLQYYDKEKGKNGLLDETPMPVVLWIKRDKAGKLSFEKTEYTEKYLKKVS